VRSYLASGTRIHLPHTTYLSGETGLTPAREDTRLFIRDPRWAQDRGAG